MVAKQKKLFIDADALLSRRPSGVGSMTIALIRALSQDKEFLSRYRIVLIVPFNRVQNVRAWGFNDTVTIVKSPFTGKITSILTRLGLMPPADAVYGRGIYLFTNFRNWPLLWSKSLTYIHDVSFRVHPEFVENKNLAYLSANIHRWIARTDVVLTVSKHAQSEIEAYYPETKDKTKVVYNGVDDTFRPIDAEKARVVLDSYGLVAKEYFIFLSNIEPRKNVSGLLDAFETFRQDKDHRHVKLLLVGGMGWKNDDIVRRIDSINEKEVSVIRPSHYVPDSELPALLSQSAALVHPAHYEGFGISPLQAMACGTQVVVANNSSIPEVVGDAAIDVNESDAKDILRGMKVAYNKRHDINEKGVQRAQKFTWEASAKQLLEVIQELERHNDEK